MTHSMKIKTSPDEQVLHNVHICVCTSKRDTECRIYTCSSPIERSFKSQHETYELMSESATNISKTHACTCVCLCVGVVSLCFMVNKTYITHYVHTYFPLRNNQLIEGVNTEAARVGMYKYSNPRTR